MADKVQCYRCKSMTDPGLANCQVCGRPWSRFEDAGTQSPGIKAKIVGTLLAVIAVPFLALGIFGLFTFVALSGPGPNVGDGRGLAAAAAFWFLMVLPLGIILAAGAFFILKGK